MTRVPLIRTSPCLQLAKSGNEGRRSTTPYIGGTRSEGTMVAGNYMNMMQRGAGAQRAGG